MVIHLYILLQFLKKNPINVIYKIKIYIPINNKQNMGFYIHNVILRCNSFNLNHPKKNTRITKKKLHFKIGYKEKLTFIYTLLKS